MKSSRTESMKEGRKAMCIRRPHYAAWSAAEFLALKHESRILGHSSNPVPRWAKEWALGCVNSPPAAGGSYRRRDSRNLGPTLLPSPVYHKMENPDA